jgi:hypothetical protein
VASTRIPPVWVFSDRGGTPRWEKCPSTGGISAQATDWDIFFVDATNV